MKLTSNELNKLIKKFKNEVARIENLESLSSTYVLATVEDCSGVPEYNFKETQNKILEINEKIRKIKHALNMFNLTTYVDEEKTITIDEALVLLPQLNDIVAKVGTMKDALPRTRVKRLTTNNFIEYTYANYKIEDAINLYNQLNDKLIRLQTSLDTINNTILIDIDI